MLPVKPPVSIALGVIAASLALGMFAGGCADTCADLQRLCNRCVDPNQKTACEALVDAEVADRCEQGVDDYTNVCK